jgi:hypothetical protein
MRTYGRRERFGPYWRQAVRFVGRALERVLSFVLAVLGALAAFGVLLDQSLSRGIGLYALSFACYVLSLFPSPSSGLER